jgi:hypothetical protein
MSNHVGDRGDVIGPITQGDKKSHLMSLWLGFSIGALVSAIIVVATAIMASAGP